MLRLPGRELIEKNPSRVINARGRASVTQQRVRDPPRLYK
jgi:hypothetical protein